MSRRYSRRGGSMLSFVALERYLLKSPAWRSLSPVARCAYIEIAHRYGGSNNGTLAMSARTMAEALGVCKDTANRAINDLLGRGFVAMTKQGGFNMKQRHAPEFRLTAFRDDRTGHPASKEFMRWTPQIQNTVRPQGQIGPTTGTEKARMGVKSASRSDYRDRKASKPKNHGPTTGTHIESTIPPLRQLVSPEQAQRGDARHGASATASPASDDSWISIGTARDSGVVSQVQGRTVSDLLQARLGHRGGLDWHSLQRHLLGATDPQGQMSQLPGQNDPPDRVHHSLFASPSEDNEYLREWRF